MTFVVNSAQGRMRKAQRLRRAFWGKNEKRVLGKKHYELADSFVPKFKSEFLSAMRDCFDDTSRAEFRDIYALGSVDEVLAHLPLFKQDEKSGVFVLFLDRIKVLYKGVVEAAGNKAREDVEKLMVRKAKKLESPSPKLKITVVPVNPRSEKWIHDRALELARDGIGKQQRETVKQILEESYKSGVRPDQVFDQIKANIGLTVRDYGALETRRELLEARGFQDEDIEDGVDKYREQLLDNRAEMIGRTETTMAESEGKTAMWNEMQDAGEFPDDVVRVWLSGPSTSKRLCEVCASLDGQERGLDEKFTDDEGNEYDEPPAHPNCRCDCALTRSSEGESA